MEPAGGAVAEHLGIPFVTVCNALRDQSRPHCAAPIQPVDLSRDRAGRGSKHDRLRHLGLADAPDRTGRRGVPGANGSCRRSPRQTIRFPGSRRFARCRASSIFRASLCPTIFTTSVRCGAPRPRQMTFPWDRLDGRPLVYASLGTLQNSREPVFRCFAEACEDLEVQLVISHGGGLTEAQAASLPGAPLVVRYAPQEDLLARAQLTFTHAGLNTVLDSLAHGVPMVTVPITYEQPAIARRVEWHGCGESMRCSRLNAARLRRMLIGVLENARYRDAAARMQAGISRAGGVKRATSLIESAQ